MSKVENNRGSIAIVGMAGRFPKAKNVDEFWQNLCNGVEGISFFTDEELAAAGVVVPKDQSNYVKARGVLDDAELFDAAFFGVKPKEAEVMDPQHRVFLECAWSALEDAGCDPEKFEGAIGVFAGMSMNTYFAHNLLARPEVLALVGDYQAMLANDKDFLPTRVSYKLNLKGPSLNIQTACSTSLVAVCVACQHLLNRQCDVALAGAVSLSFPRKKGYVYQEGGIASPDGHCRAFDANAAGTVAGEGVGIVVLKRLEDALADADSIYAVIKGFATNNDGAQKIGYTAPSVAGQAEVIALAQGMAGVEPEAISYVEAHGTGTPLGDPIEIEALATAFSNGAPPEKFCAIGSVKSNIGHLDVAAGVAGLIKTALALKHGKIPPSLHFEAPNPEIDFANSPFFVNAALRDWKSNGTPRRAGVSSFGIGGTNAHVVLEEAPSPAPAGKSRAEQLLVVSAKTPAALDRAAANLAEHLTQHPELNLADVAHTLQLGRREFAQRRAVVCRDLAEAVTALKATVPARLAGENPPVVFMFPGQGAQHVNMARELYESEPAFREQVDSCCELFAPHLGFDLRTVLYPSAEKSEEATAQLTQTAVTQAALFTIEYSLAKLWMSWGITPTAMIGHSIGEYVAACLAGVFSLEGAAALVAARGRLMQQQPAGAMLAVRLPEAEVVKLLGAQLSLATVNGPMRCVVSGPTDAVEALRQSLVQREVACALLQTSHAFHSAMMEPVLESFTAHVEKTQRNAPEIPFISNVTGNWVTAEEATDPAYWARHLRQTVRFSDGLGELLKVPERMLLECGPGQTLTNLAKQHPARDAKTLTLSSLPRASQASSEVHEILSALGQLWLAGVTVDWRNFSAHEERRRIGLPTYPFEGKRFYLEPRVQPSVNAESPKPEPCRIEPPRPREVTPAMSMPIAEPAGIGNGNGHGIATAARTTARTERIAAVLAELLGELSGLNLAEERSASFVELGFDSLFLTQASLAIEKKLGVRVAFRQLLEEFSTLDALAKHIDMALPPEASEPLSTGRGEITAEPVSPPVETSVSNGDTSTTTFPLTEAQRELWFASQMNDAASCAYNECRLLHLRGALETETLCSALQKLVDRHDALRTTFAPDGDVQSVCPELKLEVSRVDLAALAAPDASSRLDAVQMKEAATPFDLVNGPLLRAQLIRLQSDHHVLVVTVHHLVCDGHSFGILLHELAQLYSTGTRGEPDGLPQPLQLGNYARAKLCRRDGDEAENYWLREFATPAPVLELPADHARPRVWSFTGARENRLLPARLARELKRLSAQNNCTLFTTLLGAFGIVLRKLAAQNEIVIGVPIADRAVAGAEALIGHCVNFLPLRVRVDDEQTFEEHLAELQRKFLDAHEHQDYGFGLLIQRLNVPRPSDRMPLVSVTFNVERLSEELEFAGLRTELAANPHSFTNFDLSLNVSEMHGALRLDCRYNRSLFAATTIRGWLGHCQALLEAIASGARQPIRELSILSDAERRQVLEEWNGARTFFPRECVHHLFEEQAANTPDAIAVVFEGARVTYRELNERANQLANYLQQFEIGPDVLVAICVERSVEMIVGLLAILKTGGAYVSLDPTHPRERLAMMMEETHAPVLLTQEKFADLIAAPAVVRLDADWPKIAREFRTNPFGQTTARNLAYVSFTSGSTGKPKGVCVTHTGVVRLVRDTDYATFGRDEVFLQLAMLAFDASTFEIWGPLLNGGQLVIFPPEAPTLAELGCFIRKHRITTLWLTAGLFHQMVEEQLDDLRGVRQLLAGGDVLSVPHVKKAFANLPDTRLINGYGPTENTTFTCCQTVTAACVERRSIPIGRPIANTQVYVLDEHLQPVPVGVPGELHIGGDGLARGYLNASELTMEKFIVNPFGSEPDERLYRTGDLVRWLPDGTIEFLGRTDMQVKIRGCRIEPGEVEAVLARHPAVRDCAVVARDEADGKQLVAYVVGSRGRENPTGELRCFLETQLPTFMVPAEFVILDALPLSPTGKVNRHALPAPSATTIAKPESFAAPQSPTEQALARIWCDLLARETVGVHDNFFDLGGHSLKVTQALARIRGEFHVELPMRTFFESPTIAQLAACLEAPSSKATTRPASSIVEIQAGGTKLPLFLVHGAGGGMFWGYTTVAGRLGTDQPVYAFKSRALGGQEEFKSIEEMAASYVRDLRAFRPHGPYLLGGYCFGGNVAFEMARQLTAAGERVEFLALLNSVPRGARYARAVASLPWLAKFVANFIFVIASHFRRMPGERRGFFAWQMSALARRLGRFLKRSKPGGCIDADEVVDLSAYPAEERPLWQAHIRALFENRTAPYSGRVMLLRSRGHQYWCSFDCAYGWGEFAAGGVDVSIIPGAHEEILEEPHVNRLAAELKRGLEAAQARTNSSAKIETPEPAKTPRVPDEWNATEREYPRDATLVKLFEAQVARTPDAIALVAGEERLSYRELNARANRVANRLRELSVRPEVLVGVCAERSWRMIAGILGVLKAGGAYVPMDPAYPKERLAFMLGDAKAPVVLTQESLRGLFEGDSADSNRTLVLLDTDWPEIEQRSSENPATDLRAENLAYVIYTSGSTGKPKGVAIEHRAPVALLHWARDYFSDDELAGVLAATSICFDLSVFEMFVPLCWGGKVVLAQNALALATLPAANEVTLINTVPSAMRELLRVKGVPASVRTVNLAGEPLATSLVDQIYGETSAAKVNDLYGPSETTTYSTGALRKAGEPAIIGKPLANEQVFILNEQLQPCGIGETGELMIGGDGLARGYLNRPELTAEKFIAHPFKSGARLYRTGDFARWRADGNLEYLGRMDHQVKIRGFRIELGEIESVLRQHGDISEAVVVAHEQSSGDKRLAAYAVARPGRTLSVGALREFVRARLPEHFVPAAFAVLDALPLTPNGKVDRKALPAITADRKNSSAEFVAPRTAEETSLANIWREVLELDEIGVNDNFFELGGHSLLAIQVVSRVRDAMKVELPLNALFDAPTIAALAEGIASGRWKQSELSIPPLKPISREGALPASFVQERLWVIDQIEPGSHAYNVPIAVRIKGALDVKALQRAGDEIVRRHEALRTVFSFGDGNLTQVITPPAPLALTRVDVSAAPEPEREEKAQAAVRSEAQLPFNLARGPLVRAALVKIANEEHIFAVVMHHTVSDGWSLSVFFNELESLYRALSAGQPMPALPELPVQYADFAHWQRQWMRGAILETELAYWKQTLSGAPPSLQLPLDLIAEPTTIRTAARCVLQWELDAPLSAFGQRHGCTPFMICLSALAITLFRWTKQRDQVLGTVVAGRNRREVENVIGCFMNFLPLRAKIAERATGAEILAATRSVVLEAQAHQECPFQNIVEALNPGRRTDQNPLYNVAFLLQNFPEQVFRCDGLQTSLVPVDMQAALLDLRFEAETNEGGLSLMCEYRTSLFAPETIHELLESFRQVLDTLACAPETPVAEFQITRGLEAQASAARARAEAETIAVTATFTAEFLEEPLAHWLKELELPANVKFAPYNQVFQQLLDPTSVLSANSRGLNVVLVRLEDWERDAAGDEKVTAGARELVAAVKSASARTATPQLICICPSAKAVAEQPSRARFFRDMEQQLARDLAALTGVHVMTSEELFAAYPVAEYYDPQGDALGHVPYTPAFFAALATMIARKFHALKRPALKVIVLDCDNTLWSGVCGEDGPEGIQIDPPRRALQEFMRGQLDAGRLLCLCSKNNEADVSATFERRTEMPLRREHFAASRINWRPKSENLRELAAELNLGLDSFVLVDDNAMECAEVTANCPEVLALQLPEQLELIPQFLKHCWVFDQLKTTAEDARRTELYLQNRQREELRKESSSFADFLAALDLNVNVSAMAADEIPRVAQLTQRTNQFNSTTRRRTESEIQQLCERDGFEIFTVKVTDRFGDYGLAGAVICRALDGALDIESFLLSCRVLGKGVEHRVMAQLGEVARELGAVSVNVHFVPSAKNKPALDFLESIGAQFRQALNGGSVYAFPTEIAADVKFNPPNAEGNQPAAQPVLASMTPASPRSRTDASRWRWIALEANDAGKILQLIEAKASRRASLTTRAEPRTTLERQLCRTWEELLRVERVGIHDDFFQLGGHSLLAVRLFAQIEKLTGKQLPVVTVFKTPTVAGLAETISKTETAHPAQSVLVPIQPDGTRPPLFLVHGAGGDVLWGYANMAKHVSADQPMFGIQARPGENPERFATLEEMAAEYVAELRAAHPHGPYSLGGYCFGGTVAYEMARQLRELGEEVADVILLEATPSGGTYERVFWWRLDFPFRFTRNLYHWWCDYCEMTVEERRSLVRRKMKLLPRKIWRWVRRAKGEPTDLEDVIDTAKFQSHERRLWEIHLALLEAHKSQHYDGHVTVFRTASHPLFSSYENDLGWSALVEDRVMVHVVPGSHGHIFLEPHVRTLAEALDKVLAANAVPRTEPTRELLAA